MSCRLLAYNYETAVPFNLLSNPSKSTTNTHVPQQISFESQFTKSTIYVKSPTGPRRARATARIKAFYAPTQSSTADPKSLYELLGITAESGSTTVDDIKKAYKKMARKYHPDVSPPDRVDEYTRRFIMVKEAYETLSDPRSKAMYDRDLANGSGFGFSARNRYNHQSAADVGDQWKMRWQSQLDELRKRRCANDPGRMSWGRCANDPGRMSWGSRMRSRR